MDKHTVPKAALAVMAAALPFLGGCLGQADDSAIVATRALPQQRYDIVQALAANGANVIAGTQSGALLSSTDGGATWARHVIGPHSFLAVAACPDGSFFAADFYHHVVGITADGKPGKPLPLEKPETVLAATCDATGRWWVAGTFATVAMSADQGATWTVQDLGEDAHLTALQFIDGQNAVLTGEFGLFFTSADGGATWKRGTPVPNEFYPYAAHFATPAEGWLSGIAGQILHTADGGATWAREDSTVGAPVYRLFTHGTRLLGVGPTGVVERGADATWRPLAIDAKFPAFLGAAAALEGNAVAIGGPGGAQRVELPAG